jgi:NitT/TauT family transport system permease protein
MAIARAWMALVGEGGFGAEIMVSTMLALQSVALTFLISLAITYATVLPFFRPLGQFVSKMRFLSLVGLSFLFTMMVNGGHRLKVSLLVFGMVVFFVTSMIQEIESIPRTEFSHARTLGLSEWRVVWEVIILGRLDRAFEILRQNFAIAWMMLTLVEGISRAEGGVGALLLNQNKHFHLDAVFAIQVTIFVIGVGMDYLFGVLRNFLFPYANLTLEVR